VHEDLLNGLNEPQREAVLHTEGPLLVLAGPGSGKTRVITRRAAYLARTVVAPRHILAITFTNKAAREMRERIESLEVDRGMTVATFHAFCARMLREYHDVAGLPRNFTILDREDRRKLIKQAVEECALHDANWAPGKIEPVISRAKNALQGHADFTESASDWQARQIAKIFEAYETLLTRMGGLDFDDLLMRVALMLEKNASFRDQLENRFRYVLVDEYQDTNLAQYRIARMLARDRENLCATGDPDQSIYGWRGADIGNILSFERDYPRANVVKLEENYRSTKRILAAADALIASNVHRKAKTLWTQNAEGARVRVTEFETSDQEAKFIAEEIRRLSDEGTSPKEIAVIYRVNSLSRGIEEAVLRAGVRYQVARGVEFYNRKEIKDVLAYLRLLVNPADEMSFLRAVNTPPRGIGDTTVDRLVQMARSSGRSVYETVMGGGLEGLGRSAGKVRQFGELLRLLGESLAKPAADAIAFVVSQSGLRAHYGQVVDDEGSAMGNLDELISAAAELQSERPDATLVDWLEHTALQSEVDSVKSEGGRVTLMTLHAAKGLEFDVVYIIGLEEGLMPFFREDMASDEEEERRLCFVGMTRARKSLTLSLARFRMIRGRFERSVRSPFLRELPKDQLEWVEADDEEPDARREKKSSRLPDDIDEWSVGTVVQHPLHGLGRVIGMTRTRLTHVDVEFDDGSTRQWVLEYAPLTRVELESQADCD